MSPGDVIFAIVVAIAFWAGWQGGRRYQVERDIATVTEANDDVDC